jgi:hypothetical protein
MEEAMRQLTDSQLDSNMDANINECSLSNGTVKSNADSTQDDCFSSTGIIIIGETCYFASTLQLITHGLHNAAMGMKYKDQHLDSIEKFQNAHFLMKRFVTKLFRGELITEADVKTTINLVLYKFLGDYGIQYNTYAEIPTVCQQDVGEVLGWLVSNLWESLQVMETSIYQPRSITISEILNHKVSREQFIQIDGM